jgi:hypothetical protein
MGLQDQNSDDWIQYRRLVIQELENLHREQDTINRKLLEIQLQQAAANAKAAVLGALAGFAVTIVAAIISGHIKF